MKCNNIYSSSYILATNKFLAFFAIFPPVSFIFLSCGYVLNFPQFMLCLHFISNQVPIFRGQLTSPRFFSDVINVFVPLISQVLIQVVVSLWWQN